MTFSLTIRTAADKQAEALAAHHARIAAAIDAHIEAQARAMHYSSAAQLASYVASTNTEWAEEARLFIAWRDSVWSRVIGMQHNDSHDRCTTIEDLLAGLPGLEWR